jgi:cyclopropane-fatty-acyl-phospholipid synthase
VVGSGVYDGSVMHERTTPRRHRFRYRAPFAAIDLSQADELDRRLRLFAYNRWALFSLWDDDHMGDDRVPLATSVADRMALAGTGGVERVVMVGSLRTGGYVFNPLTLFYCYDAHDSLRGVLAEVSNTFGERHAYCLATEDASATDAALRWERPKSLHVSPFFGMDQRYLFRLTEPGERFGAVIDLVEGQSRVFRGSWSGVRSPLSDRSLASQALRHPLSTHMVTARIHLQAAKLFSRGVPVHSKPAFDTDEGTLTLPAPTAAEPLADALPAPPRTPLMRAAKTTFLGLLRRPAFGAVELRLPDGRVTHHGDPSTGPSAAVTIHSADLYRRLGGRGGVGLGEAYVAGDWDTDDLPAALEILARSAHARGGAAGRAWGRLKAMRPRLLRTNTRESARRDIAYHYDLGNDLYDLFLDETMTYSCAYFEEPFQSLADAQRAKNRLLLDALDIGPGDHVLEIGCGWGGFALQAATDRGARVTGITLSAQQKERAEQRIADAGLQDRIDIQLVDFRDVEGTYSAIVSIEMLEAVGHKLLSPFFSACDRLLAPGGRAGVQVICIPDQRYDAYRKGHDWIREYIFPGALLPSLGALTAAMRRGSELTIRRAEDIGPHYATTLRLWRERFLANRERAAELGYGERFARTWEYYLAFCETAFRIRALQDYQLILARPMED